MEKVTNYSGGLRGFTLKDKDEKDSPVTTKWVEPGEEIEYDPKLLVGPVPHMGDKPADPAADEAKDATIARLTAENDQHQATIADLTAQLEAATASKK